MGFKPKTCVRYNTPWHAHALTFSSWRRLPVFQDSRSCDLFVKALSAVRERQSIDLWAYVIMPDHVHLVICPRLEEYGVSRILKALKQPVSYWLVREGLACPDQVWQPGGGYDRNLWKPPTIHREIDYIHNNPVRKGLCHSPQEWRYSSAAFWAGRSDVPLRMDQSLPPREYPRG